jgi:hypothetical protein
MALHPLSYQLTHEPGAYAGVLFEDGISLLMLEERLQVETSLDISMPLTKLGWPVWIMFIGAMLAVAIALRRLLPPSIRWKALLLEMFGLLLHQGSTHQLHRRLMSAVRLRLFGCPALPVVSSRTLFWLSLLLFAQQLALLIENQASAVLVVGSKRSAVRNLDELAKREDIQPYFMWQNSILDIFQAEKPTHRALWARVRPEHLIKYEHGAFMRFAPLLHNPKNVFVSYFTYLRITRRMFCQQEHMLLGSNALHTSDVCFRTVLGMLVRKKLQKWKKLQFEYRFVGLSVFALVRASHSFTFFSARDRKRGTD